ncbi:MAG: hypothetical protein M3O67_09685, partial [Bacteroidota bacterium]|nr:hypothetical protein [Bacteroidota bacterium]
SIGTWWKLILRTPVEEAPEVYPYAQYMAWYGDPASFTVARIGAIFGLLNGTSYIPIALMFAFFSYTGIWAMYRTFVKIYPTLYKELAVAFLFIPSTFVWGSAIFKDTVCMFALGWLTYCTFRIFVNKDFSFKNIFLLCFSFYLLAVIKIYILIAFLPALTVWLLLTYSHRIKSAGMRFLLKIGIGVLVIVGFLFFSRVFSRQLERYSLENIAKTSMATRNWITYATIIRDEQGSTYDLGEFDPSFGGMIKKFPQAVVVTLFRPFPWEARKVIVMLSALEALIFLFFTIKAFAKNGLSNSFRFISRDPNLFFCLVFTLIFAFAVGISSYNFGALSRYKIPCLPFFGAFLIILLNYKKINPAATQVKSSRKVPALA